ncbi:histidine phosphatase superfamily [Phyllosticta citrichinensis]|uniref:Histidine phosphatase superfamily n=1 Tax=Phyllosticta citrichinensis TaxID=1130410 RepID=A0ABR1XPJ4_9PEZI
MPPKTIYLVRHAEGEHNVENRHHLRDPLITPLGHAQCAALRNSFAHHDSISIVVASPLKRTIQTAALSLTPALNRRDVPFLLLPLAQEIGWKDCDVGQTRAELEALVPKMLSAGDDGVDEDIWAKIEYDGVVEGWNSKKGPYASLLTAVERRARDMRRWLWSRDEEVVALVTHGSFLHYLIEDFTGFRPDKGTAFDNCEVRCYDFSPDSNEENPHLVKRDDPQRAKLPRPYGVHAHVLADVAHELDGLKEKLN